MPHLNIPNEIDKNSTCPKPICPKPKAVKKEVKF